MNFFLKQLELLYNNKKEVFYLIILFFFSISINQYYGNLGVCPIDSFWFFNSGYDALNGYYPFKDYWTITGPFITFFQAILFKLFGVTWFIYVFHASLFNFFITMTTYYVLKNFSLNINYCFFYAIIVAIFSYPSAGTPFVDHHASIISIISVLFFVLVVKKNSYILWFLLPIILGISFLSKQTPTSHIVLIISFLSVVYFLINFNIKKILLASFGSLLIISFFFIVIFYYKIPFESFYEQYISFPLTIGAGRFENFLFPLDFKRAILNFKFIHIPILVLIFIAIQKIRNNRKYLKSNDFIIILTLMFSSYALMVHQLMTLNGMFVFFIVPIMTAFAHIYCKEYYKDNKKFLYVEFFILLSISCATYYGYKYIHKRDFMDLRKANFNQTIDAKIIDNKLSGLKWISCKYPQDSEKEIKNLLETIAIIKKDERKKSIFTDYQFISVILSIYDYSPTQIWFINHVANHNKESKFYKNYKKLLVNKIKKNKIKIVYLIKPLFASEKIFENSINENCYKKLEITEILDAYLIKECNDLKN